MDNTHDDVFSRLNTAIEDWNSQLAERHRAVGAQITEAKQQLARLLEGNGGAAPPVETAASAEAAVSAAERADLTAQIAALTQERADLLDALAARDADLRKRDGLVASLEMEVAALRDAAGDPAEAALLREELDQVAAEAATQQGRVLELETEVNALRERLQAAEAARDAAPTEEDSAETLARIAELEAEVNALRDRLQEAEAERDAAPTEKDSAEALARIAELEAEADALRAERDEATDARTRAEVEVDRILQELDETRGQLAQHLHAQESTSLQAEALAALNDEVRMLQEELDAARANLAGDPLASADVEALRAENADLAAECARLQHALAEARAADAAAPSSPPAGSDLAALPPLDAAPAPPAPDAPPIEAFDARGHKKRIGEILVDQGILSAEQLHAMLAEQARDPQRRLGALVVERGYTGEDVVARILAAQLRLPYVDLALEELQPKATGLISAHLARLHHAIPIREQMGKLTVAMANPLDLIAIEDIELASKCHVDPVVATASAIQAAHARHYIPGL